jgi:hypothetical protein
MSAYWSLKFKDSIGRLYYLDQAHSIRKLAAKEVELVRRS